MLSKEWLVLLEEVFAFAQPRLERIPASKPLPTVMIVYSQMNSRCNHRSVCRTEDADEPICVLNRLQALIETADACKAF